MVNGTDVLSVNGTGVLPFNPLYSAQRAINCTSAKHFDSNFKKGSQKKSYERCDYESADDKSLSQNVSQKTKQKIRTVKD